MKDGPLQEPKENVSVQAKGSENPKKMKTKWDKVEKVTCTKIIWKLHSKNALCYAFFFVNDNKEVDLTTLEIMHYIFCYNSLILNSNPKNQAKRGLIIYNTFNGIIALKKHVNVDHFNIF
jgi:hypothetical protein